MRNNVHGRVTRPRIVMAETQHARLSQLADRALERNEQSDTIEFLLEELSRAFVVPDGSCAPNVVRIGSSVTYQEDSTSRRRRVRLVYPHEANMDENRLSVLTPIGAALIGMTVAQAIEWPTPDGRSDTITVLDVVNDQPELTA